jgi:hypothetical protein
MPRMLVSRRNQYSPFHVSLSSTWRLERRTTT